MQVTVANNKIMKYILTFNNRINDKEKGTKVVVEKADLLEVPSLRSFTLWFVVARALLQSSHDKLQEHFQETAQIENLHNLKKKTQTNKEGKENTSFFFTHCTFHSISF